ncbi:Flavin-dependent thymidylate synthase [bioreactor metagenome]|uniref:Flavin-dependent thymidylate synthase n=1 Tax=bioreactor metagenome TaxID=1076179 RepID=A0A644TMP3_9ZZZZ|nr:FAD-dependent thymidylate synthase [Negativicutes bacterium]
MRVALIYHTPEPERAVAMSARLCYSPVGAEQLAEKMSDEQVRNLIKKIVDMGHSSTLEHASFTFAVEGVSRVLTHQLVRHRIASYSQQSQRYVSEHDFEYILPPTVAANAVAKEKFEALMDNIRATYDELVGLGVHKEDARYCLANATETKIVVTMNARALLNFFSLRCCTRAQWEIRKMAELMLAEVRKAAPLLFEKAGPTCVTSGYCNEGELTCGRLEKMKK